MKPLVSIICPAYNEEAIISTNISIIYDYMLSMNNSYDFEIIIVNDGSSDSTGNLADDFMKSNKHVKVIHHSVNLNLGIALKTGFDNVSGDYTIVLDLDLSYSVDHIPKLLETIISTQSDIVIASPYMPGGKTTAVPFLRKILSKNANRFLRIASQEKYYTYTSMVRAYKTEFLKSLNLKTKNYEISPEILYKAMILRARIIEIPAHLDWSEQTKMKGVRGSGIRLLTSFFSSLMIGFIYLPYIYFLGIGFLLLIIALYLIVWIFIHTFNTLPDITAVSEFVDDRFSLAVAKVFNERPHSFFVGGFTFIAAVQFLSLGFIALQKKRYFEELYHINTTILKKLNKNIILPES